MAVLGLLGKKIGMVQVIEDGGRVVGCTVLQVGPCPVTQIRTPERDGYAAVQVGFGPLADWKATKAERGHTGSNGALRHLAEFPADDYDTVNVGQTLTAAEVFAVGDRVDIQGVGKGKGFQGVVKRHHFAGGPKTHGQSDRHRAPGSIGAGSSPGRVFRGTRMAGRMGGKPASTLNLEVVRVQAERGLIFVNGSVPGATTGLVRIRQTKRKKRSAS
ncbi:MAG: large subunit ribosomal protein L3 [Chloroflexi bacterium]|nr:MAG: large subunit ribosomal protein L3 [Chloroflexota bacterium]